MSQPSRDQYLESKVLTASQPQLHMMLLDGALRFGRQAQTLWIEGESTVEIESLLERMANIVDELTHGTATAKEAISEQLEEQYAFIYRELAACRINQEPERLKSCLELLTYQRETWKLAIEQMDTNLPTTTPAISTPTNKTPALPHSHVDLGMPTVGFSLEA